MKGPDAKLSAGALGRFGRSQVTVEPGAKVAVRIQLGDPRERGAPPH